jgi:hypothetical protein
MLSYKNKLLPPTQKDVRDLSKFEYIYTLNRVLIHPNIDKSQTEGVLYENMTHLTYSQSDKGIDNRAHRLSTPEAR